MARLVSELEALAAATPPSDWAVAKSSRWRGTDVSVTDQGVVALTPPSARETPIAIQINKRPIYRRLRLPPPQTLAAECDVCTVELEPPLSLTALGPGDGGPPP